MIVKTLIIFSKDILYRTIGLVVSIPVILAAPFKVKRFNPDHVGNVLVFSWGGLGNFMMLLPFLKNLETYLCKAKIFLVTMSKTQHEAISALLPEVSVVVMPREEDHIMSGKRFLAQKLAGINFDLSFHPYLEHTGRSIWWSWFMGTKMIVGFAPHDVGPWQTVRLKIDARLTEGENYLKMLRPLDSPINISGKMIELKKEIKEHATAFIGKNLEASRRIIGFHCGSSALFREKRWDKENFISLVKSILIRYNDVGVILFFGPDEADLYPIFVKEFDNTKRVSVIKTNDFALLCGLLDQIALFVTNDSGLMHLASMMDVPIVSIWGPTDPVKNRPWGKQVDIIRLGLPCSPCYRVGQDIICTNSTYRECLKNISTAMVFDVIKNRL